MRAEALERKQAWCGLGAARGHWTVGGRWGGGLGRSLPGHGRDFGFFCTYNEKLSEGFEGRMI